MEKIAWDGPKWGQEDFFLLIQALPTFWAERIWILIIFDFLGGPWDKLPAMAPNGAGRIFSY